MTKPDTLPASSESETAYLNLAKNQDVKFLLGWHVLKNRDYDSRMSSLAARNQMEMHFLSHGVWTQLSRSDIAVGPLRRRLSRVLLSQIKQEVPSLLREIELKLDDCKTELRRAGQARGTETQQRRFLLDLSQEYRTLSRAAVDGVYGDEFFGDPLSDDDYQKRVRAVVQNLSLQFAASMRRQGHRYNVVGSERDIGGSPIFDGQIIMTRKEYLDHAKVLLTRSRGRELPGTFNPLLIADLFHEQCSPWKGLVHEYLKSIFAVTRAFAQAVIQHLAQDDVAQSILDNIIEPKMRECISLMTQKAESTMLSHQKGHPITYNHYFTETIQDVRSKRMESDLTERLHRFMGVRDVHEIEELNFTKLKKSSLISALSVRNEVDMDSYACSEAVDCMFAYYKVWISITWLISY